MLRAILILILLGLINAYAVARIIYRWPWAEQHEAAAWTIAFLFFLLQILSPFGDRLFLHKLRKRPHMKGFVRALDWTSYTAFGLMSLLMVYGLIIDCVSIVFQLLHSDFDPFLFDRYALYAIIAATLLTAIPGIINVLHGPQMKEVEIPLKNLPAAFDGFTIAQVSDLHVGMVIKRRYTQNVVDIVNDRKPDMVALTGDFVDGSVDDLADDVAPLSSLQAPHGVYFVTGNHEYYSGVHRWVEQFKKLGARVLLNEHVVIRHDGAAIILAGVTDYTAGHMVPSQATDPAKSLQGSPEGLVKILLAHQPLSYRRAADAGFDLQLSGHTHGGQYFPFTVLVRFFQPYHSGLNRYKNLRIYINRGTGYWGPPFRTRPSEITLITLRRQAS
jgi:predicted MPP superfamily phosphohydrolase